MARHHVISTTACDVFFKLVAHQKKSLGARFDSMIHQKSVFTMATFHRAQMAYPPLNCKPGGFTASSCPVDTTWFT